MFKVKMSYNERKKEVRMTQWICIILLNLLLKARW